MSDTPTDPEQAGRILALSKCLHAVMQVMDDPGPAGYLSWLGVEAEAMTVDGELPAVAVAEAVTMRIAGRVLGRQVLATFELVDDPDPEPPRWG